MHEFPTKEISEYVLLFVHRIRKKINNGRGSKRDEPFTINKNFMQILSHNVEIKFYLSSLSSVQKLSRIKSPPLARNERNPHESVRRNFPFKMLPKYFKEFSFFISRLFTFLETWKKIFFRMGKDKEKFFCYFFKKRIFIITTLCLVISNRASVSFVIFTAKANYCLKFNKSFAFFIFNH